MTAKLKVEKKKRGWFWRLVAPNGKNVALGGEPFASASNARRGFFAASESAAAAVAEIRRARLRDRLRMANRRARVAKRGRR